MNVGFISLGCSKNLIDTEMMIGLFKKKEYDIVSDPSKADIIVVNTCGFIESAKEEAIDTILEMAKYKKKKYGKCKILIATGCLVERYKDELKKALPEVDIFLKYSDYAEEKNKSYDTFKNVFNEISKKIDGIDIEEYKMKYYKESKEETAHKENRHREYSLNFKDRVVTTGKNYAYIRIAEGCSNRCTYCAIPYIRGNFVSRKIEDIIEEAKKISESGRQEIILIAQDTSKYGIDIYGKPMLAELITKLSKIEKIKWIRFLYTYPETIDENLIKVVKNNDKICKYFDIPIQHISDKVLKMMNRQSTAESIKQLITKLRKEIPEVVIRTTVMVGFPNEEEEDFNELYDFIKEEEFDKLGAFIYSKEDGTPAAKIKQKVHPSTKKFRYNKIMNLQNNISKEKEKDLIGKELEVLVEDISKDYKYYIGRSYMDVPDIDGKAYIINDHNKEEKYNKKIIGKFIKVKVIDASDYDIFCEVIKQS